MGNARSLCSSSTSDEEQNAFFPPEDALGGLDELMIYIEKCLAKATATHKAEQNPSGVDCTASSRVASLIKKGENLLNNVLKRCANPPSKIMSSETRKVVIDVLKVASKIQWVGVALSIVAYLLQEVDDAFANKEKCVQILRYLYGPARHIKQLEGHIPREKLHDVAEFIFKGSFFCISRIRKSTLSSFFSSAVDVEEINSLQSKLGQKYFDLTLDAVTELLNRIPLLLPPSQGEHPDAVGIDEAKLEVTRLLGMNDDVSTRAVVVHGIPGMGKTTLATAVFSSLDLKAYKYCFVIINQNCSERDLKKLQKQILNDLFGKRLALRDSTEGQREISKACKIAVSQPLFLFIDNALRSSDLAKLLPEHLSWMPKGSKILLTTRKLNETDMLDHIDISRVEYHMNSLPDAEAKKLLSKKTFGNPDATFDSSLDIVGLVRVCGGIPLVLDFVGSKLRKRRHNLSSLNSAIQSFKDSLGRGEGHLTEKVVDVAYHDLEEGGCKVAFLDIAAFFANWERHIVSYIVGEMELATLEDAALVKISNGRVQLHDVVLRRGRKLSNLHTITDPKSLADALKDPDPQRLKNLEGIFLTCIADGEPTIQLQAEHLDRMSNLRILCLARGTTVSGICTGKFDNLRCLIVGEGDCSPVELSNLPRLAIFEGRIRSDNRFCDLPHSLRRLKVYCFESVELDERFGNLVHLEELELWQDKKYMRRLPQSFGQLRSLRRLCLRNFIELISLPESFGQLINLNELNMSDCPKLVSLSYNFCQLSNLKKLEIINCTKLSSLSENFGQLESLEYLRICGCESLERLSADFSSLTSVAAIDASGCPVLEGMAVDQMIELESLMMLDIKESPMLISRWEEIKEGHPLLVQTEKFENSMQRENMYNHSVSTALFDGKIRFVNVDGVVADWSSIFQAGAENVALLLTCRDLCSSSKEEDCEMVKKKMADLSSEGFQIIYVELIEQSERSIEKTLLHLSQSISGGASLCAWIAPDHRWKQLFGFSAYEMAWHWFESQAGVHTFIAHAHIALDKPQVQLLELKFPEKDSGDYENAETKFEGKFASQFSSLLNINGFLNPPVNSHVD